MTPSSKTTIFRDLRQGLYEGTVMLPDNRELVARFGGSKRSTRRFGGGAQSLGGRQSRRRGSGASRWP